MATFVKGNAIENAVEYELYEKTEDDKYSLVTYAPCGKNYTFFDKVGLHGTHIDDDGNLTYDGSEEDDCCTWFIHVDDLVDDETTGICVSIHPNYDHSNWIAVAYYRGCTDYGTIFGGGMAFNNQDYVGWHAEDIRYMAASYNAKYVVFYSKRDPSNGINPWVNTRKDIMFRPDDYNLPQGVHQLVVKAIGEGGVDLDGDGVIYEDSDYCLGADGNPLSYTC